MERALEMIRYGMDKKCNTGLHLIVGDCKKALLALRQAKKENKPKAEIIKLDQRGKPRF